MIINSNIGTHNYDRKLVTSNRYSQKAVVSGQNVSFGYIPKSFGSIAKDLGLVLAMALLYSGVNFGAKVKVALDYPKEMRENKLSMDIGWTSNIRVLAACGQNQTTIVPPQASYSKKLNDLLKDSSIKSLEQANSSLENTGYKIDLFKVFSIDKTKKQPDWFKKFFNEVSNKVIYPLSTPSKPLEIFNKEDKDKNRFIVCLNDPNAKYSAEVEKAFITSIADIYKINPDNIVESLSCEKEPGSNIINDTARFFKSAFNSIFNKNKNNTPTSKFEKNIDLILDKIKKVKNLDTVELLIVYGGHGTSESLKKGSKKFEGAMDGILSGDIKEKQIKKILNNKLAGIKTLVIFEACNSGAWIADNTLPNTINALKKLA